jgi:hypothetical protein
MGLLLELEATLPNGFYDIGLSLLDVSDIIISMLLEAEADPPGSSFEVDVTFEDVNMVTIAGLDELRRSVGHDHWYDLVEEADGTIKIYSGGTDSPCVFSCGSVRWRRVPYR